MRDHALLSERYLPCSLFKGNHMPPSHEKPNELLAEDTQRLVSLVLALICIFLIIKLPDKQALARGSFVSTLSL